MTPIYARFIAFVTYLAHVSPRPLSSLLEVAGLALVRRARYLPPMPRKSLSKGVPYIALGVCQNLECGSRQTLFSPYGGEGDAELCCPVCEEDGMVIA